MNNFDGLKVYVLIAFGFLGAMLTKIIGVWTSDLITLIYFNVTDLMLGLIICFIFKNSPKTKSGGINSKVFIKGFFKKFCMLLMVGVSYRLDILFGISYLRTGVIISLIVNELISITENLGLLGIPLPKKLKSAIDVLQKKSEE